MAALKNLITDCIQIGSKAKNKIDVLREISRLAGMNPLLENYSEEDIFNALKAREDLDSTGFVNSVAIPHCSLPLVNEFVTGALIIPSGVDFESHDGAKTKIFFFIVGPPDRRNAHIHLLSSFSHMIKNEAVLDQLINASSKEDVAGIIRQNVSVRENKAADEKVLFQAFVHKEKYFDDILEILYSSHERYISVVEANSAEKYLHNLPLYASYTGDKKESYCRIIQAVVSKFKCNNIMRKINMISRDMEDEPGILFTVNDLFYSNVPDIVHAQELKKKMQEGLSTAVFVDYENIYKQLEKYNKNPIELDFFNKLAEILGRNQFKIQKFIVFTNFDQKEFRETKHQTLLQSWGLETRHTSNYGKNSADLELTVDVLNTLHHDPHTEVFVLISCDRDLIPLVKALKAKNKVVFIISTEKGTHNIVKTYADYYMLIDDLFDLGDKIVDDEQREIAPQSRNDEISVKDKENARELCRLFYTSNRWKEYTSSNIPITLVGYVKQVTKKMLLLEVEIYRLIDIACGLGYISVYEKDADGKTVQYIKDGKNAGEILRETD
ncbi:MAG: PTS sugar transporter subunit IIA [Spirochaetales bacterium]|nr:PTS sugar transporter subunit IIA [Spirochaetales bacterium]